MDQAINKQKTALSTTIFSTFDEKNGELCPLTKNDLDLSPTTLKFNRVCPVVKAYFRSKYHQAECCGSSVIVITNFFVLSRNGK